MVILCLELSTGSLGVNLHYEGRYRIIQLFTAQVDCSSSQINNYPVKIAIFGVCLLNQYQPMLYAIYWMCDWFGGIVLVLLDIQGTSRRITIPPIAHPKMAIV